MKGLAARFAWLPKSNGIFTNVRRCRKRHCWRPNRRCRGYSAPRCSRHWICAGTARCARNRIDRQNKTLALSNGETLAYDLLLIATGGRARLPSEAWGQHPQVYTLRHWQDAQRLKQRLASATRLAIVGGGWIGLEIAASARKSGVAVTLYEQQPALCMRSVSMEVSQALDELHRGQGVDIRRGCGALELEDDNGLPTLHCDGQRETFDAVVVGIGVDLNLELARDAGLTVDRGIVVNAQGRSDDPAIFAAGDVAQHHQYGLCIQSWAFAQNQAIATAKAMLNPQASGYDEAPWLWSDQYDRNVQILGIRKRAAGPLCVTSRRARSTSP